MLAICLLAGALQAGQPADTLALALDAVVRRAERVSPRVAAAKGALLAPQGIRAESIWPFPDNPTLEYGSLRRSGTGSITHDRDLVLSQPVEIAGQWIWRRGAASRRVDAMRYRIDEARRTIAWEARRGYLALVIASRTAALADSAAAFAERLGAYARRQFEAGETNRLDWNLARLEAARARSVAERARGEEAGAQAELSRLLDLGPDSVVVASGLPPLPEMAIAADSLWVALALERRPDLLADRADLAASALDLRVARLDRIPDLTLSWRDGREADLERLRGFSVGLSIPLFHRGQSSMGRAAADRAVSRAAAEATTRAIRADVMVAAARLRRTTAAVRQFETEVLQAARENVELTGQALSEGEVSLIEVLVLRRTAIDAQLEYLAVLHDAMAAWFDLAAAMAIAPDAIPALTGIGG